MKAFAALESGKTGFVDVPVPEPGDYEALVKIEGCVICNTTDKLVINNHFGSPGYPVLVGHESFGKVVKVGAKVKNIKIGDRVNRPNAIPSGYDGTYYSTWGGFAEYGIVGDYEALKQDGFDKEALKHIANKIVQGDLSLEEAGLIIPLSETASCLMQLESIRDKNIVVMGTGIAGLSLVFFAKQLGARCVVCVGRRTERLNKAKKLGADEVFLSDDKELSNKILEVSSGDDGINGADYIFEATGKYNIFEGGMPFLKEGSTLAIYGMPEKPYIINNYNSPQTFRVYTFQPKEYLATDYVCKLLKDGMVPVKELLTHRWSFEKLPEAFEKVRAGEVVKGIVVMQ